MLVRVELRTGQRSAENFILFGLGPRVSLSVLDTIAPQPLPGNLIMTWGILISLYTLSAAVHLSLKLANVPVFGFTRCGAAPSQ